MCFYCFMLRFMHAGIIYLYIPVYFRAPPTSAQPFEVYTFYCKLKVLLILVHADCPLTPLSGIRRLFAIRCIESTEI